MEEDTIPITFTPTIQGTQSLTLPFSQGISVLSLKNALSPMLRDVDPFAIALVYNNTPLDNSKTLAECGIHAGANVQIVINVAAGHAHNQVLYPINIPNALTDVRRQISSWRKIPMKQTDVKPPNLSASIRERARTLVERGVSGLIVIPGPNGQKQVVELDRATLELLKAMREHRSRMGHQCLNPGSATDMLDAMTTVLEQHGQDAGPAAAAEPEMPVSSASVPTMEDEQFSANVKTLLERIRKSAESRRAAISRAVNQ